ncbi:MAG: hypothetical protein JWO30_4130 [Fibrobacteres bacterium]|nr:hypothetical protein [Fibrobacterota bacterium]
MMFKKALFMAAGAVIMFSTNSFATLLSGWTGEGRIVDVYVGVKGVYDVNNGAVVFTVAGGSGPSQYAFPLTETIDAKTLMSQIYNAKTNGYWIQINTDGKPTYLGLPTVGRLVVQQ